MISFQNNPRGLFLPPPLQQSNLVKRYPNPSKSQTKKIKKKKVKKPVKTKSGNPGFLKKPLKAPTGAKIGSNIQQKPQKTIKVQPLSTLRPLPVA
jgi:hypothetical protein